jgi:predicted nucleic acid-binding protein
VIFVDTNILVRAAYPPDQKHTVTKNALGTLRKRQETLCIAPQNVVEYWGVATRPVEKNGLGMDLATVIKEVADLRQLFTLLPYTSQVLETWQRIVIAQGVLGKQVHDALLVAIMQVHSVMSILTFNVGDFTRFPGIMVLHPAQI